MRYVQEFDIHVLARKTCAGPRKLSKEDKWLKGVSVCQLAIYDTFLIAPSLRPSACALTSEMSLLAVIAQFPCLRCCKCFA
jgi:hypothetical protein